MKFLDEIFLPRYNIPQCMDYQKKFFLRNIAWHLEWVFIELLACFANSTFCTSSPETHNSAILRQFCNILKTLSYCEDPAVLWRRCRTVMTLPYWDESAVLSSSHSRDNFTVLCTDTPFGILLPYMQSSPCTLQWTCSTMFTLFPFTHVKGQSNAIFSCWKSLTFNTGI